MKSISCKKTDEYRFTLKFDEYNPKHRKVVELLNRIGRMKSSLIAEAICAYYGYETTDKDLQAMYWELSKPLAQQMPTSKGIDEAQPEISGDWVRVSMSDVCGEGDEKPC